ncbi:hypothetical protein [Crossiella sp. CA198]|uniref:hypothetical protein n=1 Tax=Crossiella sp. CA198 TaxID=3455607 RepID=UPI003F8D7B83
MADLSPAEATSWVTEYVVSCLPYESLSTVDGHTFAVTVAYAGHDRWAVRYLSTCYAADGTRSHEPLPSARTEDWLSRHRFDLDTALRIARWAAPQLRVNGRTVADALRRHREPHVADCEVCPGNGNCHGENDPDNCNCTNCTGSTRCPECREDDGDDF